MAIIDERLLRRVHSAQVAGYYNLSQLAQINHVPYKELKEALELWRNIHGKRGPVSHRELNDAAMACVGPAGRPTGDWFFT